MARSLRSIAVALLVSGAACSRSSTPPTVSIAAPSVSGSVAPVSRPAAPAASPAERAIAHSVVVDLRARATVRTLLTDDDVYNETDDGTRAYEHLRADSIHRFKEEVRAYDIATGTLEWTRNVRRCYVMKAAPAGAFCDSDKQGEIVLLDRATGAARSLAAPGFFGNVSSIERVGPKIVVIGWFTPRALFFDAATGAPAGSLAIPAGFQVARAKGGAVCGVATGTASVDVLCFDAAPRVTWSKKVAIRDGQLRMADDQDALVTTPLFGSHASPAESVVVSLDDGREVARVHAAVASLVRREGGPLAGLLRAPPNVALLDLAGHELWTTRDLAHGDSARALVAGDTLVVAVYRKSTTGAELVGLDRATGAKRWTGDVELLPISHSVYSNDVTLRLVGGAVVMRGREAMLDYLELFDPATGKRLYSTVRRR
jgi:outer membrane protein assembly factor BamB